MTYPDCPFRVEENGIKICDVAVALAEQYGTGPVRDDLKQVHVSACEYCSKLSCPQVENVVTCSLAVQCMKDQEASVLLAQTFWSVLGIAKVSDCLESVSPMPQDGCGSELHRLLKEKGYDIEPDCHCVPLIKMMNVRGPEWATKNMDTMIVPMMVSEAQRRKIKVLGVDIPEMFLQLTAKKWVKSAIRRFLERKNNSGHFLRPNFLNNL